MHTWSALYRGADFRKAFTRLSEVRSAMPANVKVMALTATATSQTRNIICQTLGMRNIHTISISPEKGNMIFAVEALPNIHQELTHLTEQLKVKRNLCPRTVIFCRTLQVCSQVYETIHQALGPDITEPPGAPNLSRYRLMDMYTSVTAVPVKDNIEKSMKIPDATLRVLACTTAFGMGVDCKGVRIVLHWGPPSDIEGYIQEVGRGGRDDETSKAILYFDSKSLKNSDKAVKEYCTNTEICRRQQLLSNFPDDYTRDEHGTCACCDICQKNCKCATCMSV